MDNLDLNAAPNPFSAFADSKKSARRNLLSSAKLFGISVGLFCVVVAGQHLLQDTAIQQWLHGKRGAPSREMLEAFARGSELETAGINGVIAAIGSDDAERSALGYRAIETARKGWTTLRSDQRAEKRKAVAVALLRTSESLDVSQSDPRQQRLVKIADAIAQEVLAEEAGAPLAPMDSETFELAMRLVAEADRAMDRFAPIADSASAAPGLPTEAYVGKQSWTDWPPEPMAAPKLVRPQINSLNEASTVPQLLAQTAATTPLPPSLREIELGANVAATLEELPPQPNLTLAQWKEQLQSGSFLVRLRAVKELAKRDTPEVRAFLKQHLMTERDPKVALRIRQNLNLVGR